MNVREKIGLFDRNDPRLHIFREGRFAKLYNKAAFLFSRHFRSYKVIVKEGRTGHYYTVGFPSMMLEEVVGEVAGCELIEVDIGHHVCANAAFAFDEAEYAEWCGAAEQNYVPRPSAPAQYPARGWGYPAAAGAPMPVQGTAMMPQPVPVQGMPQMAPLPPQGPAPIQPQAATGAVLQPVPVVVPQAPLPQSAESAAAGASRADGSAAVTELAGEILRFRLESASPVECMLFLENLRRKLLDGAISESSRL